MLSRLSEVVYSYWRPPLHSPGVELVKIIIQSGVDDVLDFVMLHRLSATCRKLHEICTHIFNLFRSIVTHRPLTRPWEAKEYQLFRINGRYTKGHSSWFIVASCVRCVDWMSTPVEKKSKYVYISCGALGCPGDCGRYLSDLHKILLIHPNVHTDASTKSARRGFFDKLCESPYKEYLVPWALYSQCNVPLLTKFFLANEELAIKYRVLIHEWSTLPACGYWQYLYASMATANFDLFTYEGQDVEQASLEAIRLILSNSTNYFALGSKDVYKCSNALLNGAAPVSLHLLKTRDSSLNFLHMTTTDGFALFLDRGAVAHSLVFAATSLALRLINALICWPTPTPIGIGAIGLVFEGVLATKIAGSFKAFGGVSPYAKFIVLCYLFGIPPTTVILTPRTLVPVGFTEKELFTSESLMVSDIIYELGGRCSDDYILFRTECINLLCKIRLHYTVLLALLDPILQHAPSATIDVIKQRWVPCQGGQQEAISNFIRRLNSSAKGMLGLWTIIGY